MNTRNTGLVLSILLLFFGGCTSNSNETDKSDSTAVAETDENSVPVEHFKDQAYYDSFTRDSLRMREKIQIAANTFTNSFMRSDYKTYASFLHPAIIQMNGGMDKMIQRLGSIMPMDSTKFTRILTGPIQKIHPALLDQGSVTGWYALMPVRRWLPNTDKSKFQLQWLAVQALDNGKRIYFIDITQAPLEKVYQLMPDLRFVLDNAKNTKEIAPPRD